MKWELDLWYELWDRVGSQGLDSWYELRGEGRDGRARDLDSEREGLDSAPDGSGDDSIEGA